MPGWRDRILSDLVPGVAPVTLAADPDGLLLDEELLAAVRERGFDPLTFEDPAAFRLEYESRFRCRTEGPDGGSAELLLRFDHDDLASAPYDLLHVGRPLRFTLGELFPGLSVPVLAALDRGHLDAVHEARAEHGRAALGENATKDFVLRHVFGMRPAEIRRPADLLHVLLRRHYRALRAPRLLDDRFVALLQRNEAFDAWPLDAIVPDREAFFAFLQERWPVFLDGGAGDAAVPAPAANAARGFRFAGPANLPFGDADVRAYIDSLFIEGRLAPVPCPTGAARHDDWAAVGIRSDPEADRRRRFERLTEQVGDTIPSPDTRHPEWLAFAWRWAELGALWWGMAAPARKNLNARVASLRSQVDKTFRAWVENRYAGLHNQPPDPPAMVHHLPRHLSRRLEDAPERKVALVVIDGLALDQWLALRSVLEEQRPALRFRSDAVFAWAPTITSVSRQAIFAGRLPFTFAPSIHTTEKEPLLWERFWSDHGLNRREIKCLKSAGDGPLDDMADALAQPGLRAVGIVVHKVDAIMHGMELGAAGMRNQVRQWAEEGYPAALLDALLDAGFAVFLTSDHGNVEATGRGRLSEGSLVDTRGKRARAYSDTALRDRALEQIPDAVSWPGHGLPAGWHVLLAPGRSAFAPVGERSVAHGGVSLEEIVVPLIEIERTTK